MAPTPAERYSAHERDALWKVALDIYRGEEVDLQKALGTITDWMLIGPFPNEGPDFAGHDRVYLPEISLALDQQVEGLDGPIGWAEHRQESGLASVNLKPLFSPTDHVCAYALCFVTSPKEQSVQIRLCTNDSGKLWVDGRLVWDYPFESQVMLDRHVVECTLPARTVPVLLKACNGEANWGFILRITDSDGHPVENLRYSIHPPK